MTRLLVIAGAYMATVPLAQAKAQLSALPDRVEDGEDILITRHGRPVAHLPAAAPTITRLPRAFSASRKPACGALHLAIASNHGTQAIYSFEKTLLKAGAALGLPVSEGP